MQHSPKPLAEARTRVSKQPLLVISWSGAEGEQVANALHKWLSVILPQVRAWTSTRSIESGQNFFAELKKNFGASSACIVCITASTSQSTWVAFETGMVSARETCKLCPILFGDIDASRLVGPFINLHTRKATKSEMQASISEIIKHLRINDNQLEERISMSWKGFETNIRKALCSKPQNKFPNHIPRRDPTLEDRDVDIELSNVILQAANKLDLLALTYESLANRIDQLRFPNLTSIILRTYAVPNQRYSHPKHNNNYSDLQAEWRDSISSLIVRLCNREICPALKQIEVVLLSTTPDFTGTYAEWHESEKAGSRLRVTICVSGLQMSELPTFVIDHVPEEPNEPQFSRFLHIYNSTGVQPVSPLHFVLTPRFLNETFINAFVSRLLHVTNHPDHFGVTDTLFTLKILSQSSTQPKVLPHLAPPKVQPHLRTPIAKNLPDHAWQLAADRTKNELTLTSISCRSVMVDDKHFFANFAILLVLGTQGYEVVLINHAKAPWDYDVPGGKFSSNLDGHAKNNVSREVFEELGWLLDEDRLCGPIGLNYDQKSVNAGGLPGVIQYFKYVIDPASDWQTGGARPQKSTKQHGLTYMKLAKLIEMKKAAPAGNFGRDTVCHIPLPILESLMADLRCP
jgi:hypothetical protein